MLSVLVVLAATPICHAGEAQRCDAVGWTGRSAGARGATDTLGRGAWLIDEENDEVLLVSERGVERRVKVGAWPEQLVVESSGRVFVTCRQAGRVDVIGEDLRVESIPIGPEPRAIALDEGLGRLWVGTVTGRQLVAFDARTLEPVASREVALPLSSLAPTGAGLAAVSDRAEGVSFYPPSLEGEPLVEQLEVDALTFFDFGGPGGPEVSQLRPVWLVPAGDGLFVVSRSTSTGLETPAPSGGYGGGVAVPHQLMVHAFERLSEGLSTARTVRSLAQPDVAAVTLRPGMVVVASRTQRRSEWLDAEADVFSSGGFIAERAPELVSRGEPLWSVASWDHASSTQSTGVSAAAAFEDGAVVLLEPALRRLSIAREVARAEPAQLGGLGGLGRRGDFAMGGVFGRMPRSLRSLELQTLAWLPESALDPELRLGKALFHDTGNGRLTRRGLSCANCHPDGREDGLVWEQSGTFRQTPMLAGGRLHETAPFNWQGSAKTLEANLVQTVKKRLGGDGLTRAELSALSRYIREGLRPVQRPTVAAPELVALGQAVFESGAAGCASCHPSTFSFTDGQPHDVSSVGRKERATFTQVHGSLQGFSERFFRKIGRPPAQVLPRRFDTPSLAHVALTAPYLHDGSARTLDELIEKNRDRMGMTSHLTEGERRALVAYLESL